MILGTWWLSRSYGEGMVLMGRDWALVCVWL